MSKDINIFDYINSINYKKKIEYDPKKGSAYMLMLWMSHDNSIINIINKMNKYVFSVEDKNVFNFLYYSIPRGRRFLKWIRKEKSNKKNTNLLDEFEHSGLSKREIMIYGMFFE